MTKAYPDSILKSIYVAKQDAGKATGLAMILKLKYEHLNLTSFSS